MRRDPEVLRVWRERSARRWRERRAQTARDLARAGMPISTLARVSRARMEREAEQLRWRGSTMRQGRGMAVSDHQRRKVRAEDGCRVRRHMQEDPTTETARQARAILAQGWGVQRVDPAHVTPRSLGGCDMAECVIPLSRCLHDRLDSTGLWILDALTVREQAHAVLHLGVIGALKRVTGCDWRPLEDTARTVRDRLPHLDRVEQAEHVRVEGGLLAALEALTGTVWLPVRDEQQGVAA